MAFSGPLEDRILIRELIETYANGVMENDPVEWGSVWADDAFWALPEVPGHEAFHGKKAIVEGWVKSMELYGWTNWPIRMAYVATPGSIHVSGDTATSHVFTSEVYPDPESGKTLRVRGRYDDELKKIDGAWKFTRRVYKVLHVEASA